MSDIKKLKDISFVEFADWCNRRACDGQWHMIDAAFYSEICHFIYDVTDDAIFFKKRKREKVWKSFVKNIIAGTAEIDISQ